MFLTVMALSLTARVLILAAIALILAFAWYVILIGWQLFAYASRRAETGARLTTAGASPDLLAQIQSMTRDREALFNLDHQTWQLDRQGLTLTGHYFPASQDKRDLRFQDQACVLLVHGWRDVHFSRSPAALAYLEAGISVFMPILRGHGESGGKRIDLGCRYRKDLYAWMTMIREKEGPFDYFILDGLSMGAANVLTASGDEDLPADVLAILADCGYSSLLDQGRWMIRGLNPLIRTLSFGATLIFFYLFMGYKKKDPTPLSQVAKARVPLQIFHGADDDFVPAWMGDRLFEACSSELKDYKQVLGAKHAMSEWVAGGAYWNRKFSFIEKAKAARDS